jgi:hypothetical protein
MQNWNYIFLEHIILLSITQKSNPCLLSLHFSWTCPLSFINTLKCAKWGENTKVGTEKNTSLFAETNSKYDLWRPYKGNHLTK